ncbi:MATE family efflux transporter [Amycolatopsis acidiphila]|uniref:MATE family efflux transporter n=1 Tax=Amycolatopsis acidiphila TaxID=715473 RepID=A0A557ZY73_9PSEU|nr:MATE family efflux transporter [Amycolatopsis acidiphila]TVT16944.1 MATE family efflux transporter [Amycolatopsis acidiphila]UIJ63817.1 MATE family efflux transporter [Amycolatopsis acidiphila]
MIAERVPAKKVFGLAIPALGVLCAEPLYVLVDTAVVGHLGALPLAGLALGGVVLSQISTQLTFLSYGTTSRTARLHGAGRRAEAVSEGVQATWLAIVVGLVLVLAGQLLAIPLAQALSGSDEIAAAAVSWLRIALCGAPLILVTMAGNGWMRGVQEAVRPLRYVLLGNGISAVLCPVLVYAAGWGLEGSAVANVVAQVISASLFLRALVAERVPLRPQPSVMRAQLSLGRDLVLRSLAFQACFVSAAAVAARTSTAAVGAHQIVLQLWTFLSLVLDSVAIAAQSLVGAALGGGAQRQAHGVATQITRYGLLLGCVLCAVFAAVSGVLPHAFTADPGVLGEIPHAWWFFVALQPIAGVVFALDGVLLGAGDAAFLRTATLASAAIGFLPLIWVSLALGWGLSGIWTGLSLFMLLRLAAVLVRWRSGRWAVVGAVR